MLTRPDLRPTIRTRYLVGATLLAGVALGTGVWEYAKLHVHETMPRVVDCRADATTLDCQVALDVAMFRTQHAAPPAAEGHFVVTVVDCNGLTWSLDNRSQQATITVDADHHCIEVRAYSMSMPGIATYSTATGMDGDHFLTPAEVRAKLGIRLHP